MRELMKKEKGITLIALVVTIIVLLLLAGISLQMLTGQSGTVNQASTAKYETGRSSLVEQARLDVTDAIIETGNLTEEQFKEILKQYFQEGSIPENLPEDLSEVILISKDEEYKDVLASEIYNGKLKGKVEEDEVEDEEDDEVEDDKIKLKKPNDDEILDIGDVEVNGKKLTHGWKYYYTDESAKRFYFIYEDYLENSYLTDAGHAFDFKNYIKKSNKYCISSTGKREDLINYLTGKEKYTDAWDDLKLGVEKAIKEKIEENVTVTVSGGSTVQQLAKAYNERYEKDDGSQKLEITGNDKNGFKYKLDGKESDTINVSNKEVYNNKIFFPHKEEYEKCEGYWLSSASDNSYDFLSTYVCYIDCSGNFDSSTCSYNYIDSLNHVGVRPVISIPETAFES